MLVYPIVKDNKRTNDLSGTGSFRLGGRWNSKGTYMLYTSENSSLAYLENLVYFDRLTFPPHLQIMQIEVDDAAPIYTFPDADYPANWMDLGLLENKMLGDDWMNDLKYLGIKVRSAVNNYEFNYLLNPLFPDYINLVKVTGVTEIATDGRLK